MFDEIRRYRIIPREDVEVPYKAVLECKRHEGFENSTTAHTELWKLARRYGIDPGFLEVKVRR